MRSGTVQAFRFDGSFGSRLMGQSRQNLCIVEEGECAMDGLMGRKRDRMNVDRYVARMTKGGVFHLKVTWVSCKTSPLIWYRLCKPG